MNYKSQLEEICGEIDRENRFCHNELKKLPKGELRTAKNGEYTQYRRYLRKDGETVRQSIGRDTELRNKLAYKENLMARISILDADAEAVRNALKEIRNTDDDDVRKVMRHGTSAINPAEYMRSPSGLLIPRPTRDPSVPFWSPGLRLADGVDPAVWAQTPYRENTSNLETKKHIGMSGLAFRSRAEMNLFEHIFRLRIPVHYDETIELFGELFSPDGIGIDRRGNVILFEYAEKEDEDYIQRNKYKFEAFNDAGFVYGRNFFILTCERGGSMHMPKSSRILEAFFLC